MILFFDKRNGQVLGTVDGRTHDPDFAKMAMIGFSNIPSKYVGKFIVPTKPVIEEVKIPITEQFANPDNQFKVEEKITGTRIEKKIKELVFDVPFGAKLHRHEDPKDPFNVLNCKVVLDKTGQVIDLAE